MHINRYISKSVSFVLISLWALAGLTNCSDSDDDKTPVIELSLRKEIAEATEKEQFISVKADAQWEIKFEFENEEDIEDPWCYLEEADQTGSGNKNNIKLKYYENYSDQDRSVEIILRAGNAEDRVTFTQKGNPDANIVKVVLKKNEVPANDITQFITVVSNGTWNLRLEDAEGRTPDWASVQPDNGSGNKTDVVLSYLANQDATDRSLTVVITSEGITERAAMVQKAFTGQETEIVELDLTSEAVGYTETSQTININCAGEWTLKAEYPTGTTSWVTLGRQNGTSNMAFTISYGQNEKPEERKATIILTSVSTGKEDRVTLTQGGKPTVTTPNGWLELPEMADIKPHEMFVTHNTTINGKNVRNYSMLYDTKEKISYWVAYPHHTSYIGSTKRTDAWQYDILIPESQQAYMKKSLSGTGYDRGHQIPSGDRTANYETNAQTFFYTNMTPQLSGLNQKRWARLENQVRGWLEGTDRPDTLYVVTGAILNKVGENKEVKYVNDNKGEPIAIPNYYYKVLLYRKGNIYRTIGFWFDHRDYGTGNATKADTKTVREIERYTGFNFFANLPQDVQDNIEDVIDYTAWKITN